MDNTTKSGQGSTATLIQFNNGQAVISNVILRNPVSIELVRHLQDPDQVNNLVDTLLASVGAVATNAATVNELVAAAKDLMRSHAEQMGKQTVAYSETLVKQVKQTKEDLTKTVTDLVKASVESVVKNNADLQKAMGEGDKALRETIEKLVREDISVRITDLATKLETKGAVETAVALATEGSPQAGRNYQDDVYVTLADLVAPTTDNLERTTETPGHIPRCKKGDFVIDTEVSGLPVRVAIEVTDENLRRPTDLRSVLDEIAQVKRNREADAVLYLFSQQGIMPESLPAVKLGKDFVIATTDGFDLRLLVDLARTHGAVTKRIDMAKEADDGFDVAGCLTAVEEVEASLGRVAEIHRLLGLVEQHARNAMKENEGTKTQIEHAVEALRLLLVD